MGFNQIMYYLIKVFIPLLYLYGYAKYKRAKSMDNTLQFKLNIRSKVETYLIAFLAVTFVAYPFGKELMPLGVLIGALLFLLVYFNLERMVFVGRKVIYTKFMAFEVRAINKRYYTKGHFEFYLKGGKVKVLFPVSDMDRIMETLSGSYRRGGKRK